MTVFRLQDESERGLGMKLKDGFVLREIAGSFMVVPVGKRTQEVPGVIALTESGALLWKKLEEGKADGEHTNNLIELSFDALPSSCEISTLDATALVHADWIEAHIAHTTTEVAERG